MDSRICQTSTASPAKPGELPCWIRQGLGIGGWGKEGARFARAAPCSRQEAPLGRGWGLGARDWGVDGARSARTGFFSRQEAAIRQGLGIGGWGKEGARSARGFFSRQEAPLGRGERVGIGDWGEEGAFLTAFPGVEEGLYHLLKCVRESLGIQGVSARMGLLRFRKPSPAWQMPGPAHSSKAD